MRASRERQVWLARNVIQHEPALRAWLRRRPVIGLEVDDIVQETYARLASVESVEGIISVKNYVFQTAHSVMVSHIRKSRIVFLRSIDDLNSVDLSNDEPSPEIQVIHREQLAKLLDAIILMPEKVRAVFLGRRVDELSQRQVAEKLSIPESTVEMRMRRANLLLSRSLSADGNISLDASSDKSRDIKTQPYRDSKKIST